MSSSCWENEVIAEGSYCADDSIMSSYNNPADSPPYSPVKGNPIELNEMPNSGGSIPFWPESPPSRKHSFTFVSEVRILRNHSSILVGEIEYFIT